MTPSEFYKIVEGYTNNLATELNSCEKECQDLSAIRKSLADELEKVEAKLEFKMNRAEEIKRELTKFSAVA